MSETIRQGDNQTMSQQPTPETDHMQDCVKQYDEGDTYDPQKMVPAEFARALERERDEAREYAEQWREHCMKLRTMSQSVSSKLPWEETK